MSLDKRKHFVSFDENGVVDHYMEVYYSHSVMEYSVDKSITNNEPLIGATYDPELKVFKGPKPDETYIWNSETLSWDPDPNREYVYDDISYRWSPKLQEWVLSENWSEAEHL